MFLYFILYVSTALLLLLCQLGNVPQQAAYSRKAGLRTNQNYTCLKEESLASGFQQWKSKEVNMHQVWEKN